MWNGSLERKIWKFGIQKGIGGCKGPRGKTVMMRQFQCHMFSLFISGLTSLLVLLCWAVLSWWQHLLQQQQQLLLGAKHFWCFHDGDLNSGFIFKLIGVILQQEFWQDLSDFADRPTVHLEPYLPVKLCSSFSFFTWSDTVNLSMLRNHDTGFHPITCNIKTECHQLVWLWWASSYITSASAASVCDAFHVLNNAWNVLFWPLGVNISLGNSAMMFASDGMSNFWGMPSLLLLASVLSLGWRYLHSGIPNHCFRSTSQHPFLVLVLEAVEHDCPGGTSCPWCNPSSVTYHDWSLFISFNECFRCCLQSCLMISSIRM